MHLCDGKMTHVRHTQLTKVSLVSVFGTWTKHAADVL